MSNMNLENLDKILKQTVNSISESKNQICEIAENARKEYINLENEFNMAKEELDKAFKNIEIYKTALKSSKSKLMDANKNYNKYSEKVAQQIYIETDKLRLSLAIEMEREQMLLKMRKDLEARLRLSKETTKKAENLVSHIGVAMDFLQSDLSILSNQVSNINNKHLLAIKVLESQELDRKKIAREIHDGLAQTMSNITIKAELCNKLMDIDINKTKKELDSLKVLTRYALQDIRRIIYDLRPMSLDDLGIVPTLQRHIKKISQENDLIINFSVHGTIKKLQSFIDVALFRVTQESLNNVIKHANASKVDIWLFFSEKYIELFIKDDGKGFDCNQIVINNIDTDSGYGISGMKERINLLGGDFMIESHINKGTTCKVRIEIR